MNALDARSHRWFIRILGLCAFTVIGLLTTLLEKGGWEAGAAGFAAATGLGLVLVFAVIRAASDRRIT
jgi:hypothetical protein